MIHDKKPDRRVQKTKNALRDALVTLILERGYDPITVLDIADRANVARPTFYMHYRDKEELLLESMKELYDELSKKLDIQEAIAMMEQGIAPDLIAFEHVAEHRAFYKIMLSSKGSVAFITGVQQYLTETNIEVIQQCLPPGKQPQVPVRVIASSLAGAEIGIISDWVLNDLPYTPEEMARMFHRLTAPGMFIALGLKVPGISMPELEQA